jgi:hypothetical protein
MGDYVVRGAPQDSELVNAAHRGDAGWDGERIIGVGGIFVNGDCAGMFGGATLPEGRGRGAHSALLTARAQGSPAVGCR